jgi:hypothetical protein
MSDVVAVALITGGFALVANLLTYRVTKRQGQNNVAIAQHQSDIELQKVEAENERLRNEYRESERQNRQGTYHEFIKVATMLYQRFGGTPGFTTDLNALIDRYNALYAGVMLFAPEPVRDSMAGANSIFESLIAEAQPKTREPEEGEDLETWWRNAGIPAWVEASTPRKQAFHDALGLLNEEMRKDITAGVLRPEWLSRVGP